MSKESFKIDMSYTDSIEVSQCLKELLLSPDVKLFLNISPLKFEERIKDIDKKRKNAAKKGIEVVLTPFEKLLNHIDLKQQNNILHVHFNSLDIDYKNLSNQETLLNAMFFTSSSKEICQKAIDDYGVIVICPENIKDFRYLLYGNGMAIRKHETNKWNCCLSTGKPVPCNSLIIVDNYILYNTDLVKDNLIDILDTLIPMHLSSEIEFQITIFTSSLIDAKGKRQNIICLLEKLRPNIKFSVTIIKSSSDNFHDRNIISNNILVSCGGGFDLFKQGKSQKTTTIYMYNPFITSTEQWSRKAYSYILHDVFKVYSASPIFGENNIGDTFPNFMIGEKRNRLIDAVR